MKKKNVLMMAMSLVLVAVIAVGGTLAYLTSNTDTLTNTFTVGNGYDDDPNNPALKLDETEKGVGSNPTVINPDNRTNENNYEAFAPGSKIAKDPTFYLKDGSPASFVFAKVTGVDTLVDTEWIIVSDLEAASVQNDTPSALSNKWQKVANADGELITGENPDDSKLDGYYVYVGAYNYTTVTKQGYRSLDPLFKSVVVRSDLTNMDLIADANTQIVVKGVAIQADNMANAAAAFAALEGESAASDFFK